MNSQVILTIAGFDPSGGAGVTLDSRILTHYGIYPASVITSVIAQNTRGVEKVFHLQKENVKSQLNAIFTDISISGVKLGVLANKDIAMIVWGELRKYDFPIVVDPVWKASSGDFLFEGDYKGIYMDFILPQATIVTPNIEEAEELSGVKIEGENDLVTAAEKINESGVNGVLIKGGHLENGKIDLFYDGEKTHIFNIPEDNYEIHGTGCCLAALILKNLVRGMTLLKSVSEAREEFFQIRKSPITIGSGMPVLGLR